jgi:uncharacterized protein YehS (DUF1456 family)
MQLRIPFIVLEERNKMSKWIAKLFPMQGNASDIVRFVRTEYRSDVEHLSDIDVVLYYNNLMSKKRRA